MKPEKLGKLGENLAVQHLAEQGYALVARNVRSLYGEIDIIAERDGLFVFVEVKSRRSDRFARPGDAVGRVKRDRLIKTAAIWLSEADRDEHPCRFDVVEILFGLPDKTPRIHHIENAFTTEG